MSRRNRKRDSRGGHTRPGRRALVGALALGLIFGAGLIAGQRMLDERQAPALVTVSASQTPGSGAKDEPDGRGASKASAPVSFSFYDRLGARRADANTEPGSRQTARDEGSLSDDARAPGQADSEGPLPARYTLQLAAYPSLDQARRKLRELREEGMEVHMTSADLPEEGKVYRVRIGKFHGMDEARQFQGELKRRRDIEAFVMPL